MTDHDSDTTPGPLAKMVAPPALCDACGEAFVAELSARSELTMAGRWCPHTHTVALAFTATLEGERVISRWIMETPVADDDAVTLLRNLAAQYGGGEAELLTPPKHLQ